MKRMIALATTLLISIVPLFAKDEGAIIRKANPIATQEIYSEQEELDEGTPKPLTEEEQMELLKKMGLGSEGDIEPAI